eukprot:s2926_g4.t1
MASVATGAREAIGDFLAFLQPSSNAVELEIQSQPIDLHAAQRAAESLRCNETLQQLTLTRNQLDAEGCKALAPGIAAVRKLQKLRINYSARMGVEGVEHLMNAVASNLKLREFHFGDNELDTEGWLIVCKTLESHPGIQHLDLSWAVSESVSGAAAEACGAALAQLLRRNQVLEALLLTEDHLGTQAVIQLVEAASSHPSLKRLELNYNEMKDEGATAVANMLRSNTKLEILCLHANDIGAIGIEALCRALTENQSLRSIDLRHNVCGDIGAPLGEALRHSRVECWDLRYMQLGVASFTAIADYIGPHVKDLYFGDHDPLPLECLRSFAKLKGSNLESLKMDLSQQLPDSLEIDLVQCLQNNLLLRDFCFSQDGQSCPEVCHRQLKAIIAGSALQELNAQNLDADDVQLLAKATTVSSTFTTLRCQTTPSALKPLLELLAAPCSLKVLDLSGTRLSGASLARLMSGALEELCLSKCGLSEADVSDLASSLAATKSSLERLDLSRNPLGGGVKVLATALASNRSLKSLNLHEVGLDNETFNALAGSLQQNHSLQELIFSGQVDDATQLAEALKVNSGLRELTSLGDLFAGAQAQLLATALETNCYLCSLELEHATPKKLKKDEAYRSAMKTIEWLTTRNSQPALVLNSSFTKSSSGLRVCLCSLGGEQVLDLEVDASASLQQLIPRVFEALGPLRPLRLLLPDGGSWQMASSRVEQLGAAGYAAQCNMDGRAHLRTPAIPAQRFYCSPQWRHPSLERRRCQLHSGKTKTASEQEQCCEVSWKVPKTIAGRFQPQVTAATAVHRISAGDEVERCIAIRLEGEVPQHLKAFCYEFQDQWILPLGHALMFDQCHSAPLANLEVEWQGWRGRDVLTFSATKDINPGEPFCVAGAGAHAAHGAPFRAVLEELRRTGTIFQAAASKCGLLQSGARQEMTLSQSNVMLCQSPLHDLGCFASCGMGPGDIAEHIPVLPLPWGDVRHQPLRDFVFASDLQRPRPSSSPYVVLPLGFGAFFNHSFEPNVCLYRYDDWPFLQAVVCQEDVEPGEELLLDYGAAYWAAPWRDAPRDDGEHGELLSWSVCCGEN